MQNLTQIKSRQLHKYTTIEPFARSSSYNIIEDEKMINKHPSFMRSPNENNYQLANVVKQILEMKPRTSQKLSSKQSSRNHKTQTIVQPKPTTQFLCNNAERNNQNSIECLDNEEQVIEKRSLSKQKRHFNFLQIDNRLNSKNVKTSKSSRAFKRDYDKNSIQTHNTCNNTLDNQKKQKIKQKTDLISNTEDNECRIRITKRKTECQIPKSKISIKNLDKLIDVLPPKSDSKTKPAKYDLHLPRPSIHTRQFQQDCQIIDIKGWKQRRTKKSITDFKVPEFIKISLQAYQQEPTYLIQQLQKRKKREEQNEKIQKVQVTKYQAPVPPLMLQIQKQFVDQVKQDQKLMTNKIRLMEKDKRKVLPQYQAQVSHQNHHNTIIQGMQQNKIEKIKAKPKKKQFFDEKLQICGWQDQDSPQTLYFKL